MDGCPLGISATLVQRSPDGDDWRVVWEQGSVGRRYSQIELQLLTADFACRKFHIFLHGKPFTIVRDHKDCVDARLRVQSGIQAREE